MKYKMVALDMDGTLLNDQKRIPEENKTVLNKLHNMEIHIVIATGRTYPHAMQDLGELNVPIIVVANNGNSIWNPKKREKLMTKHMVPSISQNIMEYGKRQGLYPIIHVDIMEEGCDFFIYEHPQHPAYKAYLDGGTSLYKRLDNISHQQNIKAMVICYSGEFDNLKILEENIQYEYGGQIHTHIVTNLKNIGPLLEISTHNGTKWDTILEYANSLGIEPEEIIAIGDDNNDITMLSKAGLGIAVANASPDVKEIVKRISSYSNEDAGVARILAEIYDIELGQK